jgi:hypothetical protein
VALAGDAAQVFVHFVRVTTKEIVGLGDSQLAKISGDGRTDGPDAGRAGVVSAKADRSQSAEVCVLIREEALVSSSITPIWTTHDARTAEP